MTLALRRRRRPGGGQFLFGEEADALTASGNQAPQRLRIRSAGKAPGEADDGDNVVLVIYGGWC